MARDTDISEALSVKRGLEFRHHRAAQAGRIFVPASRQECHSSKIVCQQPL